MNLQGASTGLIAWKAPQCPFSIEYSATPVDDIRLAVADAFFSLPRGGAEIGGVLLGTWDGTRLEITSSVALDCEHAFGPSFNLSPRDEAQLEELVTADYGALRPVGWYHSHTRSEIFLSDADLEIHRRFFPESWQVALVLRPNTFHPMRGGFFFREPDGSMRSESSYLEFQVVPLPMKAVAKGTNGHNGTHATALADPNAAPSNGSTSASEQSVDLFVAEPQQSGNRRRKWVNHEHDVTDGYIEIAAEPEYEPAPVHEPLPELDADLDKPAVKAPGVAQPANRWLKVAALAALGSVAWAGYFTREGWLPRLTGMPTLPPRINLNVVDHDGQLQIRWDSTSPAIAKSAAGVLRISGIGPFAQEIPLDREHLLNGYFTFQRQSERVDVSLIVPQPSGLPAADITTFIGKLPDKPAVYLEDPASRKQRDQMSVEMQKMKTDLDGEMQQNRKLQKSIDQLKTQLTAQTKKRLANQDPGK